METILRPKILTIQGNSVKLCGRNDVEGFSFSLDLTPLIYEKIINKKLQGKKHTLRKKITLADKDNDKEINRIQFQTLNTYSERKYGQNCQEE